MSGKNIYPTLTVDNLQAWELADSKTSTGIMMSTLWNQSGIISIGSNYSVTHNAYCPQIGSIKTITGCTNTAAGQIIYYFIEKKGLKLSLTLNDDDEYTSSRDNLTVDIKADGSTKGTISFNEINSMLRSYDIKSANHAAALMYACGVVQHANYGESTSTAWNIELFQRSGLTSAIVGRLYWNSYYYCGYKTGEDKFSVSDGMWEVVIENLQNGSVVGASIPGHAIVIDGYDSSNGKFHLNYGWGKSGASRWYSKDEMIKLNFNEFVYDLSTTVTKDFTVNDADLYGTGTLLRAFERARFTPGKNTITFADSVSGKKQEHRRYIEMAEITQIDNFNVDALFVESLDNSWGIGFQGNNNSSTSFDNFSGSLIVNTDKQSNAAFLANSGKLSVKASGGIFFAGRYNNGSGIKNSASTVLSLLKNVQNSNGSFSVDLINATEKTANYSFRSGNQEDIFELDNKSIAMGRVETQGGNDTLTLLNGSKLYGTINMGSGSNNITVDSSSSIYGNIYNNKTNLSFVLKHNVEKSDAMFHLTGNAYNIQANTTLSADISKAANGVYTLFAGSQSIQNINSLKNLSITINDQGKQSAVLSVNGISSSTYAKLYYENYSLKMEISSRVIDSVFPVISSCSISQSPLGYTFTVQVNASDNLTTQDMLVYHVRYAASQNALTKAKVLDGKSFILSEKEVDQTLYYQIGVTDSAGNQTWSQAQSFKVKAVDSSANFRSSITQLAGSYSFTVTAYAPGSSSEMAADNYRIRYASSVDALEKSQIITGRNFSLKIADAGKTYYYQVGTPDQQGKLVWGGANQFTVKDFTAPEIKSVSILQSASDCSFTITADVRDNLTALDDLTYMVKYAFSSAALAGATAVSGRKFTLSSKSAGKKCYYQLGVCDSAGNISWSAVNSVTVREAKNKIRWHELPDVNNYSLTLSQDNFQNSIFISAGGGNQIFTLGVPSGNYQWQISAEGYGVHNSGTLNIPAGSNAVKQHFKAALDNCKDIFFAESIGNWELGYMAKHIGMLGEWNGTGEIVSLAGKNIFGNIFEGSLDSNVLLLTDSQNGDALFVEDTFTALPETVSGKTTARFCYIDQIRAGNGDDVIDMTSQEFYSADAITVAGGDGNDTIWAGSGNNQLFGDRGNDRIIGGSGSDLIAGGSGNDSLHGGGGNDIFTFGSNWGKDSVEQLSEGSVTLWFDSGSISNWNAEKLTYTSGANSVTLKGISADKVSLKFGNTDSVKYAELAACGAFEDAVSEKIYEKDNKGFLA
ncbi:MAG: hypothetical protein E7056_05115 [Lentisphaerae bacterium]|nr:hypothetical protein [Lentisphaerota bacterium]